MRTFQGQNPEYRRVHTCKSWPSNKKLRKVPDSVEVHIIDGDDDDSSKDYSVDDSSKQLVLYSPEITNKKLRKVPDSVEVHIIDGGDDDSSKDYSVEDSSKQLVLYSPDKQSDIDHYTSPCQSSKKPRYGCGTVLPSIGAYLVQCASCYKWRIVPTKEKYEQLRESISHELFVCTRASEWNRALSCDEPEDMSQDGSRVWALDRPNIAQPPRGWDREVRIRGASTKFADVYYTSPSGKKLRSLVEIGRYLAENPHYIRDGVNLSQFSFAIPKPLPEMSDRVHLHQPEVSDPPAQHHKKRTLKQVSSRKCQRTLPAASPPFEEKSGGHMDIEHVAL